MTRKEYNEEDERRHFKEIPVKWYFNLKLGLTRARGTGHYEYNMLQKVFNQNHINAIIGQLVSMLIILGLSFMIDNTYFQIPAAASLIILFSIFTGLVGAFSYWTRGWRLTFLIFLVIILNFIIGAEMFSYKNKAFGLSYDENVPYTIEHLEKLALDNRDKDLRATLEVLNNWKAKQNDPRPPLVIVNVSGGGLRSAAWTTHVLQELHKETGGEFFRSCHMITGASGGIIGAAYFRSLAIEEMNEPTFDATADSNYMAITKDILNPLMFTMLVNDLFAPWQKTKVNGETYRKDRGYIFEHTINRHTSGLMDHHLGALKKMETTAMIPSVLLTPTIVNDERRMLISTRGMSFLCRSSLDSAEVDGVDIHAMFGEQADELRFLSGLRMSATYPYILPMVHLPTEPSTQIMDAGFRDNFGTTITLRYIHELQDWINANTSGVIIVQIRDSRKRNPVKPQARKTLLWRLLKPITNLYENMAQIQDYDHDLQLEMLSGEVPIKVIRFEYAPLEANKKASLSWHLTLAEKNDIRNAFGHEHNWNALEQLRKAME